VEQATASPVDDAAGTGMPRRSSSAMAWPYIGGWVMVEVAIRFQNSSCGYGPRR
jgi:hypothetical protein